MNRVTQGTGDAILTPKVDQMAMHNRAVAGNFVYFTRLRATVNSAGKTAGFGSRIFPRCAVAESTLPIRKQACDLKSNACVRDGGCVLFVLSHTNPMEIDSPRTEKWIFSPGRMLWWAGTLSLRLPILGLILLPVIIVRLPGDDLSTGR